MERSKRRTFTPEYKAEMINPDAMTFGLYVYSDQATQMYDKGGFYKVRCFFAANGRPYSLETERTFASRLASPREPFTAARRLVHARGLVAMPRINVWELLASR
jgi:hypothetical protein